MTSSKYVIASLVALLGMPSVGVTQQVKRPVTPEDCVSVRYLQAGNSTHLQSISMSPDGNQVAYLIKAPNLATNHNDIELHVMRLSGNQQDEDRPILTGGLESVQWLHDGAHVAVLAEIAGRREVEEVNLDTGDRRTLVRATEDITEYRIDSSGTLIVFAVAVSSDDSTQTVSAYDRATGYRIPFKAEEQTAWPQRRLFLTRRDRSDWSIPIPVSIRSPFSHDVLSVLTVAETLEMSLSPDGRSLLIQYYDRAKALPAKWESDPVVSSSKQIGFVPGTSVLVLYRTDTGITSVPFETPFATGIALWSSDSTAFAVFAKPPVGSTWAKQDAEGGAAIINHGHTAHLFWVQPDTGKTELIATHEQASNAYSTPLYWGPGDDLITFGLDGKISQFVHQGDHWVEGRSSTIPIQGFGRLAGNGRMIVGDMQSATTPPELFVFSLDNSTIKVIQKLNPQFDDLALAQVRDVSWKTSTGRDVEGTLFLPPNYEPSKRYPLVIQTKPYSGNWFMCDQGAGHFPSFIPQPLASAGIAYLGFYFPDDHDGRGLESYYPKGYPGGIAEAAFQSDVYDTAVESLAAEGFVDPNKVGIIGFSRSGWYTEFALMFGKTHYSAATAADNVNYSFSEFAIGALIGLDPQIDSSMYGGPPLGSTLANWLRYSISFNLDKIDTPLLMEQMGYGNQFNRPHSPPIFVTLPFETFAGLNLLHKPVEMYFYPEEEHEPDQPLARLANLQRNLDWYRFWLQGYERPNAADPDQYKRWERLRSLQDANTTLPESSK